MARYEHFLAPTKSATFPAQVITAECVGEYHEVNGQSGIEVERLTSWHCATMIGKGGTYGKVKTWSGEESQLFWTYAMRFLAKGCQTYLLLWRAQRILSLLNCWKKLEIGELLLKGLAASSESITVKRWRNQTNSACITADPPTVLELQAPGCAGTLTVLDTRNYGIDRDTIPTDPAQWCIEVCHWFRDASKQLLRRKLGGWKSTAASQAYHSWRYSHLKHTVLCHTTASALDLERRAYFGGRCECFWIGSVRGPIYHLDFRSLYPYCAQTEELPVRLLGCWHDYQSIPKGVLAGEPALIADVTLQTSSADYPVRRDGSILWPIGRFRTALAGPELRHAEQTQRIHKYHAIAAYETAPVLKGWVTDWYTIREYADREHDKLMSSWAKRILVSLVGKLGQRETSWRCRPDVIPDCPWQSWYAKGENGELYRFRSFNWSVQQEIITPNGADSVPAMAGWITSAARMRLAAALECAGRHNVYYVDTDSLICNAQAHIRLLQGGWIKRGQLGFLQEKGIHSTADFFNVKHYALDGEIKCSGMPQGPLTEGPSAGTLWYTLHCKSALRQMQAPSATRQLRTYKREDVYQIGRVIQSGQVVPLKIGGM